MAAHSISVHLLFLALVASVRGQICGTAANQPCNATQSHQIDNGQANFFLLTRPEDGTQVTSDIETATLTESPDVISVVFASDPDTTYEVDLPFANYSACFVTRFSAAIGCRLWVYEGTAPEIVEACKEGHVQACGEPVYSTYNDTLCASGPTGSA
ncbi:hypothetical protein V5799_011828 [Amblyomma americanum]|uniref:Secreted protein n=1 Tax=Amblyomma americanum TaxID=6943 RepID=A0AAQ4EFS4_AMBAM